jgi:hypothetical protein
VAPPELRDILEEETSHSEVSDVASVASLSSLTQSQTQSQSQSQSQSQTPQKRKKFVARLKLSHQEEIDVADWYRDHPEFWKKSDSLYKDSSRKARMLDELATSLQTECTGEQLAVWLKSMRSRYGRLIKPGPSGSGKPFLTDKEKWILEAFACCEDQISRLPGRVSKVRKFRNCKL